MYAEVQDFTELGLYLRS